MPGRAKALVKRIKAKLGGRSKRDPGYTQPTSAADKGVNSGLQNGIATAPRTTQPEPKHETTRSSHDALLTNADGPSQQQQEDRNLPPPQSYDVESLEHLKSNDSELSRVPPRVPVGRHNEDGDETESRRTSRQRLEEAVEPTVAPQASVATSHRDGETTETGPKSYEDFDMNDTVDVDHTTTHAPAVTHETIRPHVHEIVEEQITRDIHTHEHFHYIQPVYELEVLPARHFAPNEQGQLVELSEADLPDCTGFNQRWSIGEKESLGVTPRHHEGDRLIGQAS